MANINGKALVKDGKAVDRVYSNGQLVYGRNLLSGTKDFSGTWINLGTWITDGTYKGLTVKKKTTQWNGIYKTFTAPKDGTFTFSAYVKSSGSSADIYRYAFLNGVRLSKILIGNNFDWFRDSLTISLKSGDTKHVSYEITGD